MNVINLSKIYNIHVENAFLNVECLKQSLS